jgi:hypothetical protein
MFCGECGTENPETNSFCKNCGKPLRKSGTGAAQPVAPSPVMTVTAPAAGVSSGTIQQVPVPEEVKPARNWLAVISLVVSLAAWLIYPILIGAGAVVLGLISLALAKKNKTKIPVTAILAIIIGILAIVINLFWLDLFPAPAVLPPVK